MGSGSSANQPFPNNYRAELLAFMRTYLNNPVGVHDAVMAEPVQRDVNGKMRFVSCLRVAPRESDGSYREAQERAILYVNGRLDRIIEKPAEPAPVPSMRRFRNWKSWHGSAGSRGRDPRSWGWRSRRRRELQSHFGEAGT